MVEFALLLLPLTLIIIGIFEFGIIMYDKAVVTNASREGARAGIVYLQPGMTRVPLTTIQTVVNTYCTNHLVTFATTKPTPTTQLGANGTGSACVNSGDPLDVYVTYNYTFLLLPNFINGLGASQTLTAETFMRCE